MLESMRCSTEVVALGDEGILESMVVVFESAEDYIVFVSDFLEPFKRTLSRWDQIRSCLIDWDPKTYVEPPLVELFR